MGVNENKKQLVINNYFSVDCNVDTTIRQAYELGFNRGMSSVLKGDAGPENGLLENLFNGLIKDEIQNVNEYISGIKLKKDPATSPCIRKDCSFSTRISCCGCPEYWEWKDKYGTEK